MKPILTIAGRVCISLIFLMSAVGNKIPNFNAVAETMAAQGVPLPQLTLVGGIVLLVAGSLSLIVGYRARVGAGMLLVFLVGATYYFHAFWNYEGEAAQMQMIQFLKNLSLAGTMLFIIANGPGAGSFDNRARTTPAADNK